MANGTEANMIKDQLLADVKTAMKARDKRKVGALRLITAEIKRRDQIDSTREEDPLKQADDAILVDSSAFSFDKQVQYIVKKIKESIIIE